MFFFLDYSRKPQKGAIKPVRIDTDGEIAITPNCLYLQLGRQRLVELPAPEGVLLLLGDPVFESQAVTTGDFENLKNYRSLLFPGGNLSMDALFEQVRGHYYWFWIRPDGLQCGSALGAIFPIYYVKKNDRVQLCSSSFFLAGHTGASVPDRGNLLERLLFNYPLFQSTWWEGVQLLPAHHTLQLEGGSASVKASFRIEQYFGTGADQSKDSLCRLAELFEAETRLFLPETRFGISFTGGFDGRTLLAAARKAGRADFLTYSFGHPDDADVTFPQAQTRRLGIPYEPVLLDEAYVQQAALPAAQAFMELTEYNGNFGRPHYQYTAQRLSERLDYFVTGNFGSELFRALHQPGVMMSENLIRIFSSSDDSWKDFLNRPQNGWNKAFFQQELDKLIAHLEDYLQPMQAWDANQRFYHFVFTELFRKYFGPELVMQSHYLNNRTPYLSLRFIRALNETVWSGVHARLFEKMKNKRMKGQLFYAAFIRHTDRQLYRLPTSKGYSPADVLEAWRLPLLVAGVLRQKFLKKPEVDTNAVEAFFQRSRAQLLQRIKPETNAVLQEAGIHLDEKNLEETIKFYSIAAGWAAAEQAVNRPNRVNSRLQN